MDPSPTEYPAYWSSARNSHAHGWSAGPTYVLSTRILGIHLVNPMGKQWRIQPNFGDLTSVEGGYATNLGKFTVKWSTGTSLQVETPDGTEGDVIWQGETRHVTGGGVYIWDSSSSSKGVKQTPLESDSKAPKDRMGYAGAGGQQQQIVIGDDDDAAASSSRTSEREQKALRRQGSKERK